VKGAKGSSKGRGKDEEKTRTKSSGAAVMYDGDEPLVLAEGDGV